MLSLLVSLSDCSVPDVQTWAEQQSPKCQLQTPVSPFPLAAGFSRLSHTSELEIGIAVASLQGAWHIGSVLRLVGSVSVYCDWVR